MTEKNPGVIYKLRGKDHYGLALNKDQKPAFSDFGRVFMRLYLDIHCQIPYKDEDGKHFCGVSLVNQLDRVGFQD